MWKPTTVFPVPVGREQVSQAAPGLPRHLGPSAGPTWWALNDGELLLQGLSDGPILAGVQLVAASRDVQGLSLQKPVGDP